jgi:hypothetical protein
LYINYICLSVKLAVGDTQTPLKKQRFPNLDIDALELPASYGEFISWKIYI